MSGAVITFLSDYGRQDEFVGVCHGVMAGICPTARIIDITHGIPRHDIQSGAVLLRGALPYMPVGVHVAVVDPDVGASRRAVALRLADERLLVGPDNGLLWEAAEAQGGVTEAVEISSSPYRLERVSATFHGRDLFAPVAAHLAAGTPLADVGSPCDPEQLVRLELPGAELQAGALAAHVRHIDRFGNVQLSACHEDLDQIGLKLGHPVQVELAAGRSVPARYVRTFADAPHNELIVYEDAAWWLAIAVTQGNAAARLGLAVADSVKIRPA